MNSKYLLSQLILLLSMSRAFAQVPVIMEKGGDHSGGGSGCRGEFMASVEDTSRWLKDHGAKLNPAVDGVYFSTQVHYEDITVIPDDVELNYKGEAVTAFYDGSTIEVRCDRLLKETKESLHRVVAHEVFRKMHLEGDAYEVSKQVDWTPEKTYAQRLKNCTDFVALLNTDLLLRTRKFCVENPTNPEAARLSHQVNNNYEAMAAQAIATCDDPDLNRMVTSLAGTFHSTRLTLPAVCN